VVVFMFRICSVVVVFASSVVFCVVWFTLCVVLVMLSVMFIAKSLLLIVFAILIVMLNICSVGCIPVVFCPRICGCMSCIVMVSL